MNVIGLLVVFTAANTYLGLIFDLTVKASSPAIDSLVYNATLSYMNATIVSQLRT